ncbi:hypothetical protein D3C75_755420 [compost metagenome]
MSDSLNNKELVAVGHQFAKAMSSDTAIIDIAKIVTRLAERLDSTTLELCDMAKKRDALAAENAAMKAAKRVAVKVAGNLTRGNYFDELQTKMNCHVAVQTTTVMAFMDEARETMKEHAGKLINSHNIETPATDAALTEVRAQEAVTIPDEPAGSAMYDLFYQTEHPVCRGNVQLARSEARSLASWIAENLKLRQEAAQ